MNDSEQRQHYNVTFAVILVAVTTYSMLQSLVSPVLPTIQHSLHTTQNTVTWVLTAYLLSASVATPILGRLGDMIGKKKVLVGVLVALARRHPARRARHLDRRDDRRPGDPGRGRRDPAARVRHRA